MDFYMKAVCQNYPQKELRHESGEVFPKMFMNAQPRGVAHGYETFVYSGRTDPLHQRLYEMTENAWNSIWPVTSSAGSRDGSWNHQKGVFDQNENNYQATLQNSCMQLPQEYGRAQNFDRGTTAYSYAIPSLRQNRNIPLSGQPVTTNIYQRDYMQANCAVKPDLMLGNTNNPWPWTTINGGSYFADDQELLQMFPYHTISEPLPQSLPQSCHGLAGASSLRSWVPLGSDNSFDTNSPAPSSLYSGYSVSETIPDESLSQAQFRTADQNENALSQMAWNGTVDNIEGQVAMDGLDSALPASHCGFKGFPSDSTWFDPLPTTNWMDRSYEPRTVSPEVLTLDASSTILPVKCPELLTADRKGSTTNPKPVSLGDSADVHQSVKQVRKRLPAGKPPLFPAVPTVPSNNFKKVSRSRARSPKKTSPILKPVSGKLLSRLAPAKKLLPARQAEAAPRKTQAKPAVTAAPVARDASKSVATAPLVAPKPVARLPTPDLSAELIPKVNALKRQESKDRFLVRSKLAGMSYKEIRKAGSFSEAESTLRGRFRTLTKEKEARVRRPEWEENDIRLLRKAVRTLRGEEDNELGQVKVPWRHIADYIANNGGSYHFGNATCRKKWDELKRNAGSRSP